jgi:hypothetical protein
MPSYCDSFKHIESGNVVGRMWLMLIGSYSIFHKSYDELYVLWIHYKNARNLCSPPALLSSWSMRLASLQSVINRTVRNTNMDSGRDVPAFVTKCLWSFVLMKPIHHLNSHQDDPELSDHHPSLPSYLASEHNRTRPPCYHCALTLSITHTCCL